MKLHSGIHSGVSHERVQRKVSPGRLQGPARGVRAHARCLGLPGSGATAFDPGVPLHRAGEVADACLLGGHRGWRQGQPGTGDHRRGLGHAHRGTRGSDRKALPRVPRLFRSRHQGHESGDQHQPGHRLPHVDRSRFAPREQHHRPGCHRRGDRQRFPGSAGEHTEQSGIHSNQGPVRCVHGRGPHERLRHRRRIRPRFTRHRDHRRLREDRERSLPGRGPRCRPRERQGLRCERRQHLHRGDRRRWLGGRAQGSVQHPGDERVLRRPGRFVVLGRSHEPGHHEGLAGGDCCRGLGGQQRTRPHDDSGAGQRALRDHGRGHDRSLHAQQWERRLPRHVLGRGADLRSACQARSGRSRRSRSLL